MDPIRPTIAVRVAAAAALTLFAATTAQAQDQAPARADQGADITPLCGDKPARIALVDGYGADTWRKITHAELQDEASKCSEHN